MEYAQTIAMATTLLADDRAEDVVDMVEPLLDRVTAPAASTGQILLRGLLARVEILHRDAPSRALDLLPEVEDVDSLCTCVRAEVALWRGWAFARTADDSTGLAKGTRLLREAETLFASIHDPLGQCWAALGQAQAYSQLDEPGLAHWRLDETAPLVAPLADDQVSRVFDELRASMPDSAGAKPDIEPTTVVEGLVAHSSEMRAVVDRLKPVCSSRSPVLITGEAGSGKQLIAEAIHRTSPRAEGPLQSVACAPMQQDGPLRARLFGAVNGSDQSTAGALEAADGGTLVLEDVDALPRPLQSTLLEFIEGGPTETANVRLVATTTADLDALVQEGRFREDLRDRLSVVSLRVPPLRERRADIPLLARHFADAQRPPGMPASEGISITQPAREALLRYKWPGNVRQLRNEIERALVYVQSEPAPTIDLNVLSEEIVENARHVDSAGGAEENPDTILEPNQTLSDVLAQTEKTVIERVLQACDGHVTASADVLGLTRQGLYKKMKRLDIDASSFQSATEPAAASS